MVPDFLTQRFLTRVVREYPTEAFIGQQILPIENTAAFNAMWDIITKDAKLAPFVAINAESPLADKAGFKRAFSELADVRIKELLNEDDLLALREPGMADVVLEGLAEARATSAERKVRQTMDRMTARVWGRVEWARWQVLMLGAIAYDDGKVVFNVDFGVPSGNKVVLTGTNQWSDTTNSDPLKDLATYKEAQQVLTGRVPSRCYVGSNIPGYLVQNAKIRDLLKGTDSVVKLLNPSQILDFIGQLVGLKFERYDTTYQDGSGTDTRFLNADYLVMLPEPRQSDGEVLGDVASGPAKANNFAPGLYSWIKEEEDPWGTFVGAGIHAFPRIYHPEWILSMNVKGGAG